jgi:hypothetical protein
MATSTASPPLPSAALPAPSSATPLRPCARNGYGLHPNQLAVLNDISVRLSRGYSACLTGPPGGGKTTVVTAIVASLSLSAVQSIFRCLLASPQRGVHDSEVERAVAELVRDLTDGVLSSKTLVDEYLQRASAPAGLTPIQRDVRVVAASVLAEAVFVVSPFHSTLNVAKEKFVKAGVGLAVARTVASFFSTAAGGNSNSITVRIVQAAASARRPSRSTVVSHTGADRLHRAVYTSALSAGHIVTNFPPSRATSYPTTHPTVLTGARS